MRKNSPKTQRPRANPRDELRASALQAQAPERGELGAPGGSFGDERSAIMHQDGNGDDVRGEGDETDARR